MSAAPLKVLVVDDEPPIRKLLRMGLETQGYRTMDASNAKAALELMSDKPDLVILDLGLPDMQGLELCAKFAQRERTSPSSCSRAAAMRWPRSRRWTRAPTTT